MICRRIKLREQVQWFERVTQLEAMFTFGQKRAQVCGRGCCGRWSVYPCAGLSGSSANAGRQVYRDTGHHRSGMPL